MYNKDIGYIYIREGVVTITLAEYQDLYFCFLHIKSSYLHVPQIPSINVIDNVCNLMKTQDP